jgi:hypothetical protein
MIRHQDSLASEGGLLPSAGITVISMVPGEIVSMASVDHNCNNALRIEVFYGTQ